MHRCVFLSVYSSLRVSTFSSPPWRGLCASHVTAQSLIVQFFVELCLFVLSGDVARTSKTKCFFSKWNLLRVTELPPQTLPIAHERRLVPPRPMLLLLLAAFPSAAGTIGGSIGATCAGVNKCGWVAKWGCSNDDGTAQRVTSGTA